MGFGFGGGVSHAVLLLFICFSAALFASDAEDLLGKGASIKDGETLVSSGGIFELGFFSPGTSKNRYVGIWYYSNPEKVVVWVANREAPVRDLSGTFALGNDGSLQVIGGGNVIAWSSNTSSASNVDMSAELLDTGNLVLRGGANGTGELIWQSFDHPGDTYLPGMQVGLDLRTNVNTLFTSWKSEDDPSTGRYSMGIDPRRTTQIMVWEEGRPVWRTGPWDGQQFVGSEDVRPQYLYGFKFSNVAAEQKMYFWYTAYNNSKERFRMTVKGTLDDLLWDEEKREWQLIASDPSSNCEEYNHCGDYGVCSNSSTPECNCLRGFNPRFPEEWRKGNWSGGCSRRTRLDCQGNGSDTTQKGGDGFLKFERLKLPDASDWIANVDADGCGDVCLKNCSCQAYAYVSGIGCMIWGAGLLDIQQLASGGKDLYLRLAGSELETKKNVSTAVIIASVAGIVAIIICTFILFKWRKKIKGLFRKGQGELPLIDLKSFDEDKHEEAPELPIFSFQTLVVATSNFSHSNMIGEGGFGPVYQGLLHGRKEIAVKRLSVRSGQGMEEFKTEVTLIAKLQHRNLVRLLGFCIHGEERLLIYEYMANRSLDGFIFGTDSIKRRQLDWKKRYDIIGGIARGLLYLHRDSRLTIIHRDLKASNILLDEEMNPKISDFGMARIFQDDGNPANTKRVVGTYGYMSPEYAMDGLFSVKSDVYSFGVIVLEILSGKKNQGFLHTGSSTNLLGYAWTLWIEDKAMEFVDPLIRDNCSVEEAMKCLQLGLLCVQDRPNERPMMPSVVVMLESDSTFLPQPKQPTFTVERSPSDTDSFSGNPAAGLSTNYVTTTVMIGR